MNNTTLDAEQKELYLHEIYTRRLEDDVPTLQKLGLIEQPSAARHNFRPDAFTQKELSAMDRVLNELVAVEKSYFKPSLSKDF